MAALLTDAQRSSIMGVCLARTCAWLPGGNTAGDARLALSSLALSLGCAFMIVLHSDWAEYLASEAV
jgi:hypothetical protein